MRARARALGATLTVAHRAPSGTTVALQIPPLASLA
jgi:signal transduction histidine kinase